MPESLQQRVLEDLEGARNYNAWVASLALPYLGEDPIEIGSGIGTFAKLWLESGVTRLAVSDVDPEMVDRLEADIDRYMDRVDLPPKFVIPGGTELSARLDVARAAVRRAERRVAALKDAGELADEIVVTYLNRLSDALFAMARFADEPEPEMFEGRR